MNFVLKHKIVFIGLLGLILSYYLLPLPNPLFKDDYSTVILDSNDEILRVFLNKDEQWCFPPKPSFEIPEKLKTAVLHYEDKYFYRHFGVNPVSTARALIKNLYSDKIKSGASTITMQVSRLIHPKPRTYLNKILEMTQAFKIEFNYSKEEILKLYLNHAPYGGNIIGYQAAALRYFKCLPEKLTWSQAATLAVLPNSPGLISPQNNPKLLKQKRNLLLKKLLDSNLIDAGTFELACLEEVPQRSNSFGFCAPHVSRYLKSQTSNASIIKTTINKKIQGEIENIVQTNGKLLQNLGIKNAAALVVETKSGAVTAYVGSDGFFDTASRGQVDGIQAPRSSGSILKPFLYALGMDEGYVLPQSLIKDVPSFYGSFSPANADLKYRGIISAKEALIHSLNVPAVRLLYQYGYQSFYYFLKEAGVTTLFRHHQEYGLPLILGGAETTLWDITNLYRGLANYGKFEPIYIIQNDITSNTNKSLLISPGASYLTLNILNNLNRPGAEYYWQQYQNQWPLAWKTGTSYGQRDGWAIGVSPQWTIAVWVGNFDGLGNANLSGAACAGPILFDIFNTLPKDPKIDWFIKPDDDIKDIQLCLQSGFLAGPNCPNSFVADAPQFMKPMMNCPFHKQLFVSEDLEKQVCSLCWSFNSYHSITKLILSPDVSQYLRQNGQVVEEIPAHNPDCPALDKGNPLQIVYPQKNAALWVPRDFGGKLQKINLRVAHQKKDCRVFWYLDDLYKGISTEKHELAILLNKGWHNLQVIDESGNTSQVRFYANLRE